MSMMDQGYVRAFLKFVGYSFLAIVVFFVLLFATQDEDEIYQFFSQTDLSEQFYNWWDWGRYAEDFDEVVFTGDFDVWISGDSSGLGLNRDFWQYFAETRYKEHFGEPTPYVNLDNLELQEKDENVRELAKNAEPQEIQRIEIEISTRWWGIGPVLYKVNLRAGTEAEHPVIEHTYINLSKRHSLDLSLEHGIDRELKSWAKRFYKIHGNEEMLEELYKSIYLK